MPITDAERRTLTWLAGWEPYIVENVAAVITRARRSPVAEVDTLLGIEDGKFPRS